MSIFKNKNNTNIFEKVFEMEKKRDELVKIDKKSDKLLRKLKNSIYIDLKR